MVGSYAGYYEYKKQQTRLPLADIYVWGDSRMYWGLNTELFENSTGKRVVNTAQEGASVYDMLVFADKVPDKSICILGYSECVLFRFHESDYNRSGCDWNVLMQMAMHTNYTLKELYGIAKLNKWEPKQITTDSHAYFENADTISTPEPWSGWYKMYTDTYPRFSAKGICYERAIKKMFEKECLVILLDLPGYPKMERLTAINSPNRHLSDSLINRLCSEYEIPMESIDITCDSLLYYDLSHLNERGSILLTKALQNQIDKTKYLRLKINEKL